MKLRMILIAAATPMMSLAAAPAGYYSKCEGLNGANLLKALESTVGTHTNVGYNSLWDLYLTSDVYPDGKIWDMYSTKHWAPKEQCGTYSAVGDCYNREHSFPKSWFDDASPMASDAFHIYPTDGKVNGQRSNHPYGECANGTTLKGNGSIKALGRLGNSTFPGYSGVVFEPDDEYKGDFARSYFYMAACYNSRIKGWDSPMLDGNPYPAFSSWAVNLLLKWHRQDPVSDKETDRNEAVYARQHNRNPFIDHPELAEYIWGNKKTQNWSASGDLDAWISTPVDGTVYDLGCVSVGKTKTLDINVKCINLTAPVALSTDDTWYKLSRISIPVAEANSPQGATVTVTWEAKAPGAYNGKLTFYTGNATSTVTIKGEALAGLTANAATEITDRSFVASWTYAGGEAADGTYTVCYRPADITQAFMSVKADARREYCEIDGLSPETEYIYWVESTRDKSNEVRFTTAYPIPFIQLLYDGDLFLESLPGEPSEAYEILVDTENIDSDITITVTEPFEVSTDKTNWYQEITISLLEDRFYLRLNAEKTGTYSTEIKLRSGNYVNDEIEVYGAVKEDEGFLEDFDTDASGCDTYNGCEFQGSAATWYLSNAGIWEADKNDAHSGNHCLRMGKTAASFIEMKGNKNRGLGMVSVYAKRWTAKEGDCTFHIEYSLDNGANWFSTTDAIVDSDDYKRYTFSVNETGEGRIRLQQTAGARFIIDDLSITDCVTTLEGVESDYRAWDAYCLDGRLTIECAHAVTARVFGMDGVTVLDGTVPAGTTTLDLPCGLYIVWVDDFSRRVLVK